MLGNVGLRVEIQAPSSCAAAIKHILYGIPGPTINYPARATTHFDPSNAFKVNNFMPYLCGITGIKIKTNNQLGIVEIAYQKWVICAQKYALNAQ